MIIRLQSVEFWAIGILIGTIFMMQIRSHPVAGSGTASQDIILENKMLVSLNEEHRTLTAQLVEAQKKRSVLEDAYEKNTSSQQQLLLKDLREKASFNELVGPGLRITIEDGYSLGGDFFKDSDLRDLINALYLQGANALMVNGYRVTSLTYVHAAFDTIFVGNHQINSPFIVEAIGNPESLSAVIQKLPTSKIRVRSEKLASLQLSTHESYPTLLYTSLLEIL